MVNSCCTIAAFLGGWTRAVGSAFSPWYLLSSRRLEWCLRLGHSVAILGRYKSVWHCLPSGIGLLHKLWLTRSRAVTTLVGLVTVVTVTTLFRLWRTFLLVGFSWHRVLDVDENSSLIRTPFLRRQSYDNSFATVNPIKYWPLWITQRREE